MEIATVTSKGQITIPLSIRKALRLEKGSKVILEEDNGKVIMINATNRHLDISKLVFAAEPISTNEALADSEPFDWTDDVMKGDRKVSL